MAGVKETATWETHIYQIEENDPVHGGEEGVTNKPIKQLANRTLYLRKVLTEAGQRIQPKKITGTSKNSVDLTGHTHEIEAASTSAKGLVQLTNDTGLDSESLALTAKAGKALAQSIAQAKLDTTNGLNKKVDKTSISDAVNSTSQTTVASSRAVKTAYDKGVEALNKANTKADTQDPILQTTKYYGDLNAIPSGTLFFAISERTLNQPAGYATGNYDAQVWQFDVGNQVTQVIFYGENDIKVRYNDDGVNWSDWNSILTTRNLSSAVNNPSDSVPASVAGVKTAYDHANTANQNANSRVKQAGAYAQIEVDNAGYAGLNIIRSGTLGSWSSRLEVLPDRTWKFWNNSDGNGFQQFIKAENGTFAFLSDITKALAAYIPNSQKSNAVDSTSTDTVATSRAVKLAYDRANTANNNADGRVSKSGDTMTGYLSIRAGDYSSLRTYNTAGDSVRWEAAPSTSSNMAAIVLAGNDESVKYRFLIPKQNGTAAVDGDVVHLARNEVITGEKTFHYQIKLRSNADNSKLGRIGQNTNDLFIQNGYSGKVLQLKNTGELRYDNNIIHNESMPYVKVAATDGAYAGIDISRSGTSGTWMSRIEALPDKRWKFHVQNAHDIYMPAKGGTVVLDSTLPTQATRWPAWNEVTGKPTLVQDIRLGATVRRKLEDAAWETHGAGYVVTGFHNVSADLNTNDYVYVKPIQKYINGAGVEHFGDDLIER